MSSFGSPPVKCMKKCMQCTNSESGKDIDIILIVEALFSDFAARFWEFIKNVRYVQRNKG